VQDLTFDQLGENEKVALTVAILYPHRTLIGVLPTLFKFEPRASDSTYYRYYRQGQDKLRERGMLDGEGFPTVTAFKVIPTSILVQMAKDLNKELRLLYKECREEASRATNAKTEMEREIEALKEKFDFTRSYDQLKPSLSSSLQNDIDAAIEMFKKGDYGSAIVKAYLSSEVLGGNLFRLLYGNEEGAKVGKRHQDKLKKMWHDEQLEKHEQPGIQVIASLFSVILWYRNKMGAHKELPPSMEAARTCIVSLLQAIEEFKRLGFKDVMTS